MYQKYHTEALILASREHGEADKVFALYTQEFGLVRARASGVRNERSRMRYALQQCARAQVSLVRGKRGWRIAGARAIDPTIRSNAGRAFARAGALVLRLVHGEERNPYLFAALAEAHTALAQDVTGAWPVIEIVCVARILFALGYISQEALSTALFTHTAYTGDSLLEAAHLKDKLLVSINRAIAETHL